MTPALALGLASFRSQTLAALTGGGSPGDADFATLFGSRAGGAALADPAAGRALMTRINGHEADFKAQYALLAQMSDAVRSMGEQGEALGEAIAPDTANDAIAARLAAFVADYNAWEDRFDQDLDAGGVLQPVQAAEIARNRLEASVRSIFNGSVDGVNGLAALGISIDPATRSARFDRSRLDATLAADKGAAVKAIDAFAADFAAAAELLNDGDNVFRHQLDNRARAIDFIASHRASLTAEFGEGAPARPDADTARALAAYAAMR